MILTKLSITHTRFAMSSSSLGLVNVLLGLGARLIGGGTLDRETGLGH
jgi:hypothetical protein